MPELQVRSLKKGLSRRQYKCLTLDCVQLAQEKGYNQTEMSFFAAIDSQGPNYYSFKTIPWMWPFNIVSRMTFYGQSKKLLKICLHNTFSSR